MKLSLYAQTYLVLVSLLFFVETTFKGLRYSLPIFTPGVFLIWLKVNVVTMVTKWLAVSGLGFVLAWQHETILITGFALGTIITIITLPRFKVLFFLDHMLSHIIGKNAKKPS